ncbi:MAG: hypothetical protein ACRDO1_18825 [Nocardioidaceae bacterium]
MGSATDTWTLEVRRSWKPRAGGRRGAGRSFQAPDTLTTYVVVY